MKLNIDDWVWAGILSVFTTVIVLMLVVIIGVLLTSLAETIASGEVQWCLLTPIWTACLMVLFYRKIQKSKEKPND